MATDQWRCRDFVIVSTMCFLVLVLIHQASVRSSISELRVSIQETREVALDLGLEHEHLGAELLRLENAMAVAAARPLPPLPLPVPEEAAGDHVTHPADTKGGLGCVAWRQTGHCDPHGAREAQYDKGCDVLIQAKWSGFCQCENGVTTHEVGCAHADFVCSAACDNKPALDEERKAVAAGGQPGPLMKMWEHIEGKAVAEHPNDLPAAELAPFITHIDADASAESCPPGSRSFYSQVPIVYTWVNGSVPEYEVARMAKGGKGSVGGARDRDNQELRFSVRSLSRYLPWWEGPLVVVAPPGEHPDWLDIKNPRVHIVDQESLFPENDKDVLPTFNTNAFEQHMWRAKSLGPLFDAQRQWRGQQNIALHRGQVGGAVFVHMNDDYIFTQPIRPQDLFGPTCAGVRQLNEAGEVKHKSQDEMKEMLKQSGRVWMNQVANTGFALDKRYNSQKSTYPYLKHAPFVYSVEACAEVSEEFRAELRTTMENPFRASNDVIFPLMHHAYMRATAGKGVLPGPGPYIAHGVDVTVTSQDEAAEMILLSLSGDEPVDPGHPDKKSAAQQHWKQRASRHYSSILTGKRPCKMVTLNDEMGPNNLTVVAQLHHFLLAICPDPSIFELAETHPFSPQQLPEFDAVTKVKILAENLEFNIEDSEHRPGLLESLGFSQFNTMPHHDKDDGMR